MSAVELRALPWQHRVCSAVCVSPRTECMELCFEIYIYFSEGDELIIKVSLVMCICICGHLTQL